MVFGVKRKGDSSLSLKTHLACSSQRFPAPGHSEKTTHFPKAPELGTQIPAFYASLSCPSL